MVCHLSDILYKKPNYSVLRQTVALPAGHTLPHAPQLLLSVVVFTQVFEQMVACTLGHWQSPCLQTRPATQDKEGLDQVAAAWLVSVFTVGHCTPRWDVGTMITTRASLLAGSQA
jgi:hypothetical protein